MLFPDEAAVLRQTDANTSMKWAAVAVVALLLTLLPTVIYLPGEGRVDHLLGNDVPVTAEVASVHADGSCGRRGNRPRNRIEVVWTAQDREQRGDYTLCGRAPEVGETVQVWVGPTGHVESNSPTYDRIGLASVSMVLGALSAAMGAAFVISPRRRRQRLLAVANAQFSPSMQVELWLGNKSRLMMSPTAPVPEPFAHGARVITILYTRHGGAPALRAPRGMRGSWWLRLAPPSAATPYQRIGLLERGRERHWVELQRNRRRRNHRFR